MAHEPKESSEIPPAAPATPPKDDPARDVRARVITYGTDPAADIRATRIAEDAAGLHAAIVTAGC